MRGDPQQLDRLRESANDGARNFRTVYTFYLIVSLYILVVVSSTDHELLFRAGDVQMPIINAGVSVVWFFTAVPWILLILHFNLLIQAMFLSRKINRYVSALDRHVLSVHERTVALDLLFPLPLAHKLSDSDRRRSTRILLDAMVLLSVAILPPFILIYTQVQFLPYQEEVYIWLHRSAVAADVGLLWCLWPRVAMPDRGWREWWRDRWGVVSAKDRDGQRSFVQYSHRLPVAVALVVTVLSLIFIFVVADSPGGTMSRLIEGPDSWRNVILRDRKYDLSGDVLVEEDPPPEVLAAYYSATCQPDNTDTSSLCDESSIDTGSFFWCRRAKALDLNERHLVAANLSGAVLCGIDFENTELRGADLSDAKLDTAILSGADLSKAKLHDANLSNATLLGADLSNATLLGADLSNAKLYTAILSDADLTYAKLSNAKLRDANLSNATLLGADLSNAKLDMAILSDADLTYAKLSNAKLHDANLSNATLPGADLSEAKLDTSILSDADLTYAKLRDADLWGAKLDNARLPNAILRGADLRNAILDRAILSGADLSDARLRDTGLWGAKLDNARLPNAMLRGADLRSAILDRAILSGADLSNANLHGADLWGADLRGAVLKEVELHGANLWGADFHGADLSGAKLHGANLSAAKLHGADLSGAELHGADLWGAELHGADLSGAELHGANLQQAKLSGAQLIWTKLDLADLREIDLSSRPNGEAVRNIEEISDPEVRDKALERLRRSEDEPSVEPGSVSGAVLCEEDALYAELERFFGSELPGDALYVVQCEARSKSNEYVGKLADELVGLACSDESGYTAKGVAHRSISDWVLGPPLSRKLLSTPQCQGVAKGLEMLSERKRADLDRIAARGTGASDP